MLNTLKENSRLWLGAFALLAFGSLVGCISDDSDPAGDDPEGAGGSTGGTGGSTSGTGGSTSGSGGSGATTSGPPGTACASVITIPADKPAIANFDGYMGEMPLGMWSFAYGDDTSLGVFTGPFGYGDDAVDAAGQPIPETFAMVEGNGSAYAMGIADSMADEYGGGMGLWLSACLNLTAFTGISFWVRGNAPTGMASISLVMNETTSSTASSATDRIGTCGGTDTTCIHPKGTFNVTDAWTEVRLPWTSFAAGDAAGTRVAPDGRNIWQFQFDISLVWADDGTGTYVPTPAEYEFDVDSMTLY
jgi:hypothetical protein